jgi:hypothetical protein
VLIHNNGNDKLVLILSAVEGTKEEITENKKRVNNLTWRTQQKIETIQECRRAKTRGRVEQ